MKNAQSGIATVLIMLLVGVAMTATALGVAYSVKSTQEKQATSHALINAQAVAWAAAEVFKAHIEDPATDVAELVDEVDPIPIQLNIPAMMGADPRVTAEAVISARGVQYVAVITARDLPAQSSALVELVFDNAPAVGAPNSCENDFGGGGELLRDWGGTGGITAVNGDKYLDFSVDGNVTLTSTAPKLGSLRATGNVTISTSSTELREIVANGCINISAGGFARNVSSSFEGPYNDVCPAAISLSNGANAHNLHANGRILVQSGDTIEIKSRESVTVSGGIGAANVDDPIVTAIRGPLGGPANNGIHDIVVAGNNNVPPTGAVTASGGGFGTISAFDDVIFNGGLEVGTILSRGDFTCPPQTDYWIPTANIQPEGYLAPSVNVVGALTNCGVYGYTSQTTVRLSDVPEPVEEVTIERRNWDARDYITGEIPSDDDATKTLANFYFFREVANTKVRVRNMTEYSDGDYYYSEADSRLCTSVDCSDVADATAKQICWTANGVGEDCVTYSAGAGTGTPADLAGTFVIRGITLVPGAYVFEGNVDLSQAHGINTILATHNLIVQQGAHANEALNWADYEKVCLANYGNLTTANANGNSAATVFGSVISDPNDHIRLNYDSLNPDTFIYEPFLGFMPTNLCTGSNYTRHTLGNVAVAAGSINTGNAEYEGGVVTTASNAEFFGTVVAGDALVASQHTKIYGYLLALALNTNNPTINSTTGRVDIDQTAISEHMEYTNAIDPTKDDETAIDDCRDKPGVLTLRWTRYL